MAFAELATVKNEEVIRVETTWNEKELIKIVPGSRWVADERVWTLPIGWAQAVILRGVFGTQVTFGDRLTEWGWHEVETRVKPTLALRELYEDPLTPTYEPSVSGKNLYDFQHIGADFVVLAGSGLLGDEMGTGKTVQMLSALRHLEKKQKKEGDGSLPVLVVCPNSLKSSWVNHTREWFPEAEPIMIDGSAAEKQKQLTRALSVPNAIVVINIEATRLHSRLAPYGSVRLAKCQRCDRHGDPHLTPARCEVHPKPLNQIPFKTVVIDEAHRIKDPQSKQTRAVWACMHGETVTRRWGLTGTPLANNPADTWSIMHGVYPQEYPTKSKFVDRFCLAAWNAYGGLDVVGLQPQMKDEFYRIFDPRFRRMQKMLVLPQLPPKVRTFRHVQMTPKQKKAYNELEKALITRLADGEILVAPNNLAAQTRLLQLSSSYCTLEPDPTNVFGTTVTLCEPSPKIDELEEIISEMDPARKLVVCAESRQLILLAAKRLKKLDVSHSLIIGGMSQWERDLSLRNFQEGEDRALLFTLKAGGVGLTMTAADTIVFLQRSWSMIDNKQGEDRVHRIGSEVHESVNVIDIITRGTVEERQLLRLYDKMQRLDEITRDRAALVRAGHGTEHLDAEESKILGMNLGAP